MLLACAMAVNVNVLTGAEEMNISGNSLSGETYRYEAEDMQLNHVRFPNTTGVNPGEAVGVYWNNKDTFPSTLASSSFTRMVVEAPEDGIYPIEVVYYAGKYPFRVYVNGTLTADDVLPGNDWGRATKSYDVQLKAGKNVLIFAVAAWGCFDCVMLPKELKTVEKADEADKYYAINSTLQSVYLLPETELHNPEAELYPQTFTYDTDDEYIGKATFNVSALEGYSLTFSYYATAANSDGTANIACAVNGEAKFIVNVPADELNTPLEYTIDATTLVENGLQDGNNIIEFIPVSQTAKVGLHYITLQKSDDYVPVEKNVKTGVELRDYISYRGRTLDVGTSVSFDWSGNGFAFNYEGKGDIVATITTSGRDTTRIAIYVDDENRTTTNSEKRVVKVLPSGTSKVKLASNLPEGKHTIEVLKVTEACGSLAQLDSIAYDIDGKISKWKAPDYKMLVVGGSVSCGNQIYADGTEDASLSYVANLAQAYNMDWNTITVSGRGIMQGYNSEDGWAASQEKQLRSLADYTSFFRDNKTKWDKTSFEPDVIIINAGGNDLGDAVMDKFGTTVEDFCNTVVDYSSELRQQYPNALICWFYGVYVNRAHKEEFQAAVDSMKDDGIKLVYTPQMNSGADNHPDVTEHVYLSQIFSSVISKHFGVENPLDEYNPYIAPVFDEELEEKAVVFNDFEGANRNAELTLDNKYNTTVKYEQDVNLNYEAVIKTTAANGNGVNFNGRWHYGIIAPKDKAVFNASQFKTNAKLSFYLSSSTSTNVYIGVKSEDVWYSYQGFVDSNESTQSAARNSGRLQDKYMADGWKKYDALLKDFNVPDWSKVEAIAIGFYTSGVYYVDNVVFVSDDEISEETTTGEQETTAKEQETTTEPETTTESESTTELETTTGVDKETSTGVVTETTTGETTDVTEPETTTVTEKETTAEEKTTVKVPVTTKKPAVTEQNGVEKLGRTKIKKAVKKKNASKVKVSLKKIKSATGYILKISTSRKFKKKTTVTKKTKKLSLIVKHKKFKTKKKYYVKARAILKKGNAMYLGSWSKVKKVRIKK